MRGRLRLRFAGGRLGHGPAVPGDLTIRQENNRHDPERRAVTGAYDPSHRTGTEIDPVAANGRSDPATGQAGEGRSAKAVGGCRAPLLAERPEALPDLSGRASDLRRGGGI
ncbi:hypothetical protein GCM10010405_10860 [Streptomyces macrosporus]|uniref:Uncharacterized protein n=1 Tax=Streptomyces macrosporus TaxID=44032 RepID=A0ABP5WL18_9ACTN